MAGAVFFTTAPLLCGPVWWPAALLAARVVQGAGAAIMTLTAMSIISTTFTEGSEWNKALGIWGALGGIGATAAWLIGGPLVDGPGWRWTFFINVPIGLAALALSPVLLRESRAALTRRSYDPAGALTITGALGLLAYGAVEAHGAGWGDVRTILPLAGSAVLVAAFALIESRHPRAAGAAAHLPLPDPGRRGRPDDPDRHRRGRRAVRPDVLRPAGARLLGPQVRHQLGRARARGHGRRDRRPGRGGKAGFRTAHRFLPPTPPAAAIADNTNQKEEQTMIMYEYLMKAVQDDARRVGERERLLREARRARRARRQRLVPAAPARRRTEMGKIVVSENVTLDGVIQDPAGDEGFRAGGWAGLIGNSPQLAKLARRGAGRRGLPAGPAEL
jgi:hypothetical protein